MKDAPFGEFLASTVRRHGLSMADFSAKVGLSPSTLSRVRTGQRLPTAEQLTQWADALHLDKETRAQFMEMALLARTPAEVRSRLQQVEQLVNDEQHKRTRLEHDYGRYRKEQRFHDGWWLTYSASFLNDGRIQRGLLRIADDQAHLQVREVGRVHYSYHGTIEALGDKLFIRISEDRGGFEHVQITLDSLFDYQEPSFLYGMVCGISGKDRLHPLSYPAASRILLLHVGRDDTPGIAAKCARLEPILGSFEPRSVRPCWPAFLGDDAHLRQCLRLGTEPLDDTVLRLIDNRLKPGDHVLRALLT